jgi:hypothetical protein
MLAIAATVGFASPSRAVPLLFTLSGADNYQWVLDSSPTPSDYVLGAFTAFSGIGPSTYLTFYASANSGGISAGTLSTDAGTNVFDLAGAQIYSGTEDSPVFTSGTFNLFAFGNPDLSVDTLTISATPLPAAWVVFSTALAGLVGWGSIRRRLA